MDGPKLPWLVFAAALVVLILDAGGGPGWGTASAHAVIAARMDHVASSPLYDALAGVAVLLPAGEPGFRLGLFAALLGAATLAGVVVAARALLPREPAAGVVAAVLMLIAPPFRDAAAFADPAMLAACGLAWAFACAARRDTTLAFAACVLVIGSAPWLGALSTALVAVWLRRERELPLCLAGIGISLVVLWIGAAGSLPAIKANLAALAHAGRGAAAIVVGAGLIGAGFGALTGLRCARWLGAFVLGTAVHEALVGGSGAALLAMLGIAAAIVPSAIVRAAAHQLDGLRRHAAVAAAGVPLVGAALAMGASFTVEDPAATPAQLAFDLEGAIPPGPGVFVATRPPSWLAIEYESVLAGARPDLSLVPPLPSEQADAIVANALRGDRVVGADAAAFGRLDVRRALPRGRGFQLIGDVREGTSVPPPPATYKTAIGVQQAALLAVERARHEAANGHLDMAARAIGLEARFGAANLAVLATTMPTKQRPALWGFLPLDAVPPGPWLYDLFGDDLAWVAGLDIPPPPASAPMPRRLHAAWRQVFLGTMKPDDPSITAMGPRAVATTKDVFAP